MSTLPPLFTHTLLPHPVAPWASRCGVRVSGHWRDGQALVLSYTLSAPSLSEVRVPPPHPPGPADGLWQHTCFEAFVAAPGSPAYHEYNLSPSGQWARYRFRAERERDAAHQTPACALPIVCTVNGLELTLQAVLPLSDLPPLDHGQPQEAASTGWLLGLCAVLEHTSGKLSHWALHHPRPQPDFHHPAGRVLRLLPPAD